MTKVLKNSFIGLFCLIACLFAGFFFVGCQADYSKISLVADRVEVVLDIGESSDVTISIEGYQKGFSKLVQVYNSDTSIVTVGNLQYNQDKIKLTLTGKAGGNAVITVETFEGHKSCTINVGVTQISGSMLDTRKIMYVSDDTDFVPDETYFSFDKNATDKDVSFYYITNQEIDFSDYKLNGITDGKATFGGMANTIDVVEFDKVVLDENADGEKELFLYFDSNQLQKIDSRIVSQDGIFKILSVYTNSLSNVDGDVIYCLNEVYVLPAIEFVVSGGYVDTNSQLTDLANGVNKALYEYVEFVEFDTEKVKNNEVDPITIVPNNDNMVEYMLKIETTNLASGSFLNFAKYQSNQNVIIDYYNFENANDDEDDGKIVQYFKVSQNSLLQSSTTLDINAFYDIAQAVEDESVNASCHFEFVTKIAPIDITINGTTEPESLTLYNYYKYPDFGWHELLISVISGSGASPYYDGIYFVFDDEYVDLTHNNQAVRSGDTVNLYTFEDLQESFYARGKYGQKEKSSVQFEVHLVCNDLLEEEIVKTIPCKIIAGATQISAESGFGDNGYYYIDMEDEIIAFDQYVYADQSFQYFTYKFIGGANVLDIVEEDTPYKKVGNKYYLKFSIAPKLTGIGIYRIYLDNGMPIELTFDVVKSLTTSSTSFELANHDNEDVTNFQILRSADSEYDDQMLLEILNPSNKEEIVFGSLAYLKVNANISKDVEFVPKTEDVIVSVATSGEEYKISTYQNGTRVYDVNLTGYEVNDRFGRDLKTISYQLKVVSYSLAEEFYLKNGESYALSNVVYFGSMLDEHDEARSVSFEPVLKNEDSYAFYRYMFNKSAVANMFNTNTINEKYVYNVQPEDYSIELCYETYSSKFIYFEAEDATTIEVKITKNPTGGQAEERVVQLIFENGLMFKPDDVVIFEEKNAVGQVVTTYKAEFFSMVYSTDYGQFDIDSYTYTDTLNTADYQLLLKANIRQRNLPKRYDIRINCERYKSIEGISLATNIDKIEFSNDKLTQTIGVYTYPVNSTNKELNIKFVKSSKTKNEYADMVTAKIDYSSKDNGIYTVTLSCEDFYDRYGTGIVDITTPLTGKIYIYPAEWGDDYSAINDTYKPICIDVQYRNGSRANPYLIETAEDLMRINTNKTTLQSHYEIKSVIDLSNVTNFVPIGIIKENGKFVVEGFSGSIVGTTSHSAITNIVVSENNFYKVVDGIGYGGLFAKLNNVKVYDAGTKKAYQTALENLSVSGKFSLLLASGRQNEAYVGLVAGVNESVLTNVGVKILKSQISNNTKLFFGGMVGINYGKISQDFTFYAGDKYDGTDGDTGYVIEETTFSYVDDGANYYASVLEENRQKQTYYVFSSIYDQYAGQTSKNLAYYYDAVEITTTNATVIAGGIVGASNGIVETINNSALKNYGYSGYASFALINILGEIDTSANVFVGGAVGAMSFEGAYLPSGIKVFENLAQNLLVGGEISTQNLVIKTATTETAGIPLAGADIVGGIVGISDTLKQGTIQILSNTSRTFVRGFEYVGGICGYDAYVGGSGGYPANALSDFGTNNKLQAIDDGKNSFYCAQIIKLKDVPSDSFGDRNLPEDEQAQLGFYSVGNALRNNRTYTNVFKAESYLDRGDPIAVPLAGLNVNLSLISVSQKYGDYIIFDISASKILTTYQFEFKEVKLEFEGESDFAMTSDDDGAIEMFFVYYFGLNSYANGQSISVQNLEKFYQTLNTISTNDENRYPFKLVSTDVAISASTSDKLKVDINGDLTLKDVGLAEIRLTSILNSVKTKVIYLYIVNFFDKDVTSSIFYTSANFSGLNIIDDSAVSVYGNTSTAINLVPTYEFESFDYNLEKNTRFTVSEKGILRFNNIDFELTKNSQLTATAENVYEYIYQIDENGDYVLDEEGNKILLDKKLLGDDFSAVQINKQTLVFYKKDQTAGGGEVDQYKLIPVLKVSVKNGDQTFNYYYQLDDADVSIRVEYKQTATAIEFPFNYYSIKTNEHFEDLVKIVSENDDEHLFYQIFDKNGVLVQERLPEYVTEVSVAEGEAYYKATKDDLFDFDIIANGDNTFDYRFGVNTDSNRFNARFESDIYGEYTILLYANELLSGVTNSFTVLLEEAEVNYLSVLNYSSIEDFSTADNVLVPSQRGMLEITIDPIEAYLDEIKVSNRLTNYQEGATTAVLSFVYEKTTETGVEYLVDTNFGRFENGVFTFKFKDMLARFDALNASFEANGENSSVAYTGKIFISYYMASENVENGKEVGFDIEVSYSDEKTASTSITLTTKLNSFAKLVFDDKQNYGGNYYVARGLSYDLSLQMYGFSEDQVTITSSDSRIASIVKSGDGKYVLDITENSISYNGEQGYRVTIETVATKLVDNVTVTTRDTINIFVMEYVLNYNYVDGQYQDIVNGMEDGVISVAIGNPHTLEFAIREFLEYDQDNVYVNSEVDSFVEDMTKNITWKVYYNNTETSLALGTTIPQTEYYKIEGLTVTPLKLYDSESDIYHFSAKANYAMKNGQYVYDANAIDSNLIYTEFSFDVHDQSTEDSPLPITTYEELADMQDGEWYILLNDIILPSSEYALTNGVEQFSPITADIAGLDGNGYKFLLADTYNFDGLTEIGLFASVANDMVVKNVTIQLYADTVFKTNVSTFNVGLLTATNEGVIANCYANSNGKTLSVKCSETTSSCYVAGLVANNTGSGFITNSRSEINLMSNVNLSGFVGQNSGHIASSYFLNGKLKNETNTTAELTAGFVVKNTGDIYTSYVSGKPSADKIYYDGTENTIESSNSVSGFVYTNSGNIYDCYSNIHLKNSGAFASGFVFENDGLIERCFSTSVLEGKQDSNYGFARINSISSIPGSIKTCYYLSDSDEQINISIGEISIDDNTDIDKLDIEEFSDLGTYFGEFVVTEGRNVNAVWFFNGDPEDKSGFRSQNSTASSQNAEFNTGRLELVAPNIVAESRRIFDHIETIVDTETQVSYIKYRYVYDSTKPALGSMYNPIVITSAEDMENYILQENTKANYNYAHYRLACDVDYNDYLYMSELYQTRFRGYFEGNFMTIANTPLVSSKSMTSAGLFAEISKLSTNTDSIGAVMNFVYQPLTVSFANANIVGALAGKLDGGTIVNIDVTLPSSENLIVVGNNIVGGAIGLAVGDYKIQNLYSQYGAKARYQKLANATSFENDFRESSVAYDEYSFAGSIVGVLSGTGYILNCETNKVVSVLADKAGLMFGLVDRNATAQSIYIEMNQNMLINPYSYGGLVAGEIRGKLTNVTVDGTNSNFTNFKQVPFIAQAVGGIVGLLNGGSIDGVTMTQSIQVSTDNASSAITTLGGIAGEIKGRAKISKATVRANLIGFRYVGGVAGTVFDETVFDNIDIRETRLDVRGSKMLDIALGGVVGRAYEYGAVLLQNSNAREIEDIYTKDASTAEEMIESQKKGIEEQNDEIKTLKDEYEKMKQGQGFDDDGNPIDSNETESAFFNRKSAKLKAITDAEAQLTRLQNNLTGLEKQLEGLYADIYNMKNKIEVTISANVYVYETDIDIYVGSIIGLAVEGNRLEVSYTYSTISGSVSALDMSVSNPDDVTATVVVKEVESTEEPKTKEIKVVETEEENTDVLKLTHISASRTEMYCNLSYRCYKGEKTYKMQLSLVGNPILI